MVKQVKQSLEVTDNFITERMEGGYSKQYLTSGYDLRDFIEDSQSRFTDDTEELIDELTVKVEQNRKDIRDNDASNKSDHEDFDERISVNHKDTLKNRNELNVLRERSKKLIQDDRVLGYYVNASPELTTSVNPDTLSESFLPPPGTFALMNEDFEAITDNPQDTDFIVFNNTDILNNTRTFLGIFSGDVIEISYVKRIEKPPNPDTGIQEGYEIEHQGRLTFRVKLSYDSGSQLGNSIIKVDVAFVNSSFTSDIPVYDEVPDSRPLTEYNIVSVIPSLVIDDLVDPMVLREAVLPIGCIIPWAPAPAKQDPPSGWLICDGRKLDDIKPGLNYGQTKALEEMFDKFNFTQLPPLSGRYVAGVKGSTFNKSTHSFNTLGGLYKAQTGTPTNNNGNSMSVTLADGGGHTHNANVSQNNGHKHDVGSSNTHMSGNDNAVMTIHLQGNGAHETSSAGDHTHSVSVTYSNSVHKHSITGFNNDSTRPNTLAVHYIIKYK